MEKEQLKKEFKDDIMKAVLAYRERLLDELLSEVDKRIKDLEYRFYIDYGNDKYKGEFGMYEEYEQFYKFAKKELSKVRAIINNKKQV
jgi:hypothetical protein